MSQRIHHGVYFQRRRYLNLTFDVRLVHMRQFVGLDDRICDCFGAPDSHDGLDLWGFFLLDLEDAIRLSLVDYPTAVSRLGSFMR